MYYIELNDGDKRTLHEQLISSFNGMHSILQNTVYQSNIWQESSCLGVT